MNNAVFSNLSMNCIDAQYELYFLMEIADASLFIPVSLIFIWVGGIFNFL